MLAAGDLFGFLLPKVGLRRSALRRFNFMTVQLYDGSSLRRFCFMLAQLYDGSSFMTVQHQSSANAMTVQLYGGSGILKFPKLTIAMTGPEL